MHQKRGLAIEIDQCRIIEELAPACRGKTLPNQKIAGKIILAVFFVVVITPVGIVRRALGKDPLRLRRQVVESYWMPAPKKTPLERLF